MPEGFAYYALSPRAYGQAAHEVMAHEDRVIVVGLRTIGTALSAVARAALGPRPISRLTVRPTGHPYARVAEFDTVARETIVRGRERSAFLICDEGPGKSGSSFLAVAEALVRLGVPSSRITLLGTRPLDSSLVATDAANRFSRFRYRSVGASAASPPFEWPELLRRGLPPVPAWPSSERQKRLSADGRTLHKFAGLGVYGRRVQQRAEALADRGLSPTLHGSLDEDGFLAHRFVAGHSLSLPDLGPSLPAQLGRYIASRACLPLPPHDAAALERSLAEMTAYDLKLELGDVEAPAPRFERLVVPDARLMPHEWVRAADGSLLKTDATDHGDDHFFPGPCDPAWDLAGAIVEWHLEGDAREALLQSYEQASGDDARSRLPAFLVAYSAFHARYCVMAAHGCSEELAARWRAARSEYRRALRRALPVRS